MAIVGLRLSSKQGRKYSVESVCDLVQSVVNLRSLPVFFKIFFKFSTVLTTLLTEDVGSHRSVISLLCLRHREGMDPGGPFEETN